MRLRRRVRLALLWVLIGIVGVSSSASGSPTHSVAVPPAQPAGSQDDLVVVVRLRNKSFDPPVVVIHEGDTVVWVNETKGGGWHDVQSYEGEFSSDRMQWSDAFVHTFEQPGVYGYFCSPHVFDGMQGTVVVLAKDTPAARTAADTASTRLFARLRRVDRAGPAGYHRYRGRERRQRRSSD